MCAISRTPHYRPCGELIMRSLIQPRILMIPFTDLFGNIIKAASACCCRPRVRPACAVGYSCTHSMETPPLVNKITHREMQLQQSLESTRCSVIMAGHVHSFVTLLWPEWDSTAGGSEGGSQWIVLRPKDTSTQKTEPEMRLMADIFCISSASVCFLQTALQIRMWGCTKVTFPQPRASSLSLHPPLSICVSTTEHSYDVIPAVGLWLIWHTHSHNTYTHTYTHTESRGRRRVCGRDEPPLVTRQPHTFLWL